MTFTFSEAVVKDALVLTGSLAGAANATWEDDYTLLVAPDDAWPLGAATLSFVVTDLYDNETLVEIELHVTDAIYLHTSGNDNGTGAPDAPLKTFDVALARAKAMGPGFVLRMTKGSFATDLAASHDIEDVNLDGGYDPGSWAVRDVPGYIEGSTFNYSGGTQVQFVAFRTVRIGAASVATRIEGCLLSHVNNFAFELYGHVTMHHTFINKILAHTQSLTLSRSAVNRTFEVTSGDLTIDESRILNGLSVSSSAPSVEIRGSEIYCRADDLWCVSLSSATLASSYEIVNNVFTVNQFLRIVVGGAVDFHGNTIHAYKANGFFGGGSVLQVTGDRVRVTNNRITTDGLSGPNWPGIVGSPVDHDVTGIKLTPQAAAVAVGNQIALAKGTGLQVITGAPTFIVGNTIRVDDGAAVLANASGTHFDLNLVIAPVGITSEVGPATVRWNEFQSPVAFIDIDSGGTCDAGCSVEQLEAVPPEAFPSYPLANGNGAVADAHLDADDAPTELTPCSITRAAATTSDLDADIMAIVSYGGAPRTWPYSVGAVEWDGACTCGPDEHVVEGACISCEGESNAAGDSTDGPDTACDGP